MKATMRFLSFSLCVALAAAGVSGCKKKEDPATAATRQALEDVKGQVDKLKKDANELRTRFNALPENLPGLDDVRHKLSAVEEVLGTEGARAEWLGGELKNAITSGSREQLAKISETIHESVEGSKRLAKPVIDLAKELKPFEEGAAAKQDGGARKP